MTLAYDREKELFFFSCSQNLFPFFFFFVDSDYEGSCLSCAFKKSESEYNKLCYVTALQSPGALGMF